MQFEKARIAAYINIPEMHAVKLGLKVLFRSVLNQHIGIINLINGMLRRCFNRNKLINY